jgi:hypothetical protein
MNALALRAAGDGVNDDMGLETSAVPNRNAYGLTHNFRSI